ncbi:MAG TPA: MOSC N-terminal beta barrel domain-containing protein [Pseudorhodoplanes sp.]|nr:MOSC N-terminal beta barrel domain-containing protein [Pseudorhodoplanes sp.]
MAATIQSIYRYPVKGLSPERLPRAELTPGRTLAADRLYAIENGPSGFDPAAPAYFPKQRFLMLMRNERLAALETRYHDASHTLSVMQNGTEAVRGDLTTPQGRAAIEQFFVAYCADELNGPPKMLRADGHSFSDVAAKVVSIINLASVAAIENAVSTPVDPLRFRGNVYVSGWPAWHEFDLVGKTVAAGPARLKIVKRIVRCAATNVEPGTGIRDLQIPKTLMQAFGHMDCGIYAEVVGGGEIAAGDAVIEPEPALF